MALDNLYNMVNSMVNEISNRQSQMLAGHYDYRVHNHTTFENLTNNNKFFQLLTNPQIKQQALNFWLLKFSYFGEPKLTPLGIKYCQEMFGLYELPLQRNLCIAKFQEHISSPKCLLEIQKFAEEIHVYEDENRLPHCYDGMGVGSSVFINKTKLSVETFKRVAINVKNEQETFKKNKAQSKNKNIG